MGKWRWQLVALVLLIWSYYARPAYELAWIAAMRLTEAISLRTGPPVYQRERKSVIDRAFEQGDEIDAYLKQLRAQASHKSMAAVDLSDSVGATHAAEQMRSRLRESIGYPRDADAVPAGPAQEVSAGEDEIASYRELLIPVLPGIHSTGIFVRPKGAAPNARLPLLIAAPGRASFPSLSESGRLSVISRSVRDLAWDALRHGYAVWLPTYVHYGRSGDDYRDRLTVRAWQSGTSLPALEIAKTIRSLDVLAQRADVDSNRIAMMGFSYGGFYALYTAALDPRIRAAAVMGYFNDREVVLNASEPHGYLDWRFSDSVAMWQDANVASLVVPRSLLVQAGTQDQLFPIEGARRAALQAEASYRNAGAAERFRFDEFVGRHEFNAERAMQFFDQQLSTPLRLPP